MDVWKNTTLGDGNVSEKLVQLLIIPDGQLQVTWDNAGLLVVTGSIPSQLENFSCKILKDGGEVNWSTGSDTLSVVSLSQKTVDTTDGKGKTGLRRTALGSLATASLAACGFSSGRHF